MGIPKKENTNKLNYSDLKYLMDKNAKMVLNFEKLLKCTERFSDYIDFFALTKDGIVLKWIGKNDDEKNSTTPVKLLENVNFIISSKEILAAVTHQGEMYTINCFQMIFNKDLVYNF